MELEKKSLFSHAALNFFPHFATIMLCSINNELREFAKAKGNIFWRKKLIEDCKVYCDEPLSTIGLDGNCYFYKYIRRLNVDFQQEFSRNGASGLFVLSCGAAARFVDKKVKHLYTLPLNSKCVAVCSTRWHFLCLLDNGVIVDWGEFKVNVTIVPPKDHKYIAVAGSDRHFLALLDNGSIYSWGDKRLCKAPKKCFKEISAEYDFSVGLLYDGTIMVWGIDEAEIGKTFEIHLSHENLKIVAISTQNVAICGLLEDGRVVYWEFLTYYSSETGYIKKRVKKLVFKLEQKVISINSIAFLLENGDVEFPFRESFERPCQDITRKSRVPNSSTFFKIGWFKQNEFFVNRKY